MAKSCLTLRPHELFSRLPCPSPAPRACSNSCPLSRWCHSAISSSLPSSSCPQSFRASGSFPIGLLFASGSQSIGASASVLSVNIQGWLPLGLTGLISFLSKGLRQGTYLWPNFLTNPFGKIYFSLGIGYTPNHFLLTPVFQLSLL